MLHFDRNIQLPTLSAADYVHDIAFDFHGTRLALCTSSLTISVFSAPSGDEAHDDGAAWTETAQMKRAHAGPIWRLSWGDPAYGEPLASCGEDHVVKVWCGGRGVSTGPVREGTLEKWQSRVSLGGDGPFVDVRWAPACFGLKLAACTADGRARVFECVNALDLRTWDQPEELDSVGHKLASASSVEQRATTAAVEYGSAALDWMQAVDYGVGDKQPEALAVAGKGGRLAIWVKERSASSKWNPLGSVPTDGVKDVAWCPNLSRSYEIVATCGVGADLWKVEFPRAENEPSRRKTDAMSACQHLQRLLPPASPLDGLCLVWRCSWNLTGTNLTLCPENDSVSVWRVDASGEWRPESFADEG